MERVIDRIYHEGLKALKTVKSFKILTCLALLTSVIQHYLSSFFSVNVLYVYMLDSVAAVTAWQYWSASPTAAAAGFWSCSVRLQSAAIIQRFCSSGLSFPFYTNYSYIIIDIFLPAYGYHSFLFTA